jgi:hypothetical protein
MADYRAFFVPKLRTSINSKACFRWYSQPMEAPFSGPTSPTAMELVLSKHHHTSTCLPRQVHERVEALGATRKTSPSLIILEAAERCFNTMRGRSESDARHLRVSEYTQLALDWIIQQDHPEVRERLIAEADRRMAIHHGAR